jgi:hypothetical protein
MKTRVILFMRVQSPDDESNRQILFARWSDSLFVDLPRDMGVEDFARTHNLTRHSSFDYSVGGMGREATLLECISSMFKELKVSDESVLSLEWQPFRTVALSLKDGQDRRFLQLAVQFLASGAKLDDSVVAADYDAEFIQQLQNTLAAKNSADKQ